ncbi:MAG: DUF3048 domain-containing protein [Clostridiales bacterium]|nr:DUF3048 domain-containing protein [Clostridiales bacterium]
MDNKNEEFEKSDFAEDFFQAAEINAQNDEEERSNNPKANKNKNKVIIIAVVAVVAVIAIACGVYFGCFYHKEEETTTTQPSSSTTTEAPVVVTNPLTGESGYNKDAVGKRPVSVVIDNAAGARPQYNMSAADIVVEGEVEGGETRMLWFFADMSNLPEQVGPTRSARPSFVQFSELFDSVYVHFGGSHSKGDYIGGYEIIKRDNVDDIDGMTVSSCFRRTSDKVSPHNAVLLGENLVAAIEKKKYRTDLDESAFSKLSFNEKTNPVSDISCNNVTVKFSSKTRSRTLTYNSDSKVYTNQSDYQKSVSFSNLIIMYANSTYIDKHNYKGAGNTETYLNYSLTSGEGKLISCGTVVDFNWSVDNGILSLKDKNGKELNLNPGKSWIALTSANHNGSVTIG